MTMTDQLKISRLLDDQITPVLPASLGRRDSFDADLIGSKIIGFGTIPDSDLEGGGLVIDYVPEGQVKSRRIIFEFNELGMWISPHNP